MHDDSTGPLDARDGARQFAQARELLLKLHGDPDAARAAFRWPQLDAFNWVDDWFDVFGAGNRSPALTVVREGEPTLVLSWQELSERSRRLARYFEDQGVLRGDRMLVMLGNVSALWETLLAAMRIGAVVIPATAQLTPLDVEDRVLRGEARHIVTDAAGAEKLREPRRLGVRLAIGGAAHFNDYEAALCAPARFERKATRASDPLLLYFTSGTTARPKLVLHTHASYPVGHLSTMFWLGLREGDRHQNISSPGWAKHAWSSFFAPWNAGASIVVHDQPRFNAQRAIELLREQRVNSLCAPPTVWRMLIRCGSPCPRPS